MTRAPTPVHTLARLALLVAMLLLAGCKASLYSGLDEQETNRILAVLTTAGIDAAKERGENNEWQVLVDKGDMPRALELLRAQGLPEQRYASMGDVFRKQGLVSTPSEERMRYIFAVQQELSQTLREVDGVVSARVHVVIPANDPLSDKIRPSSAAVFIKYRPDVDLRLLVPSVKDLVAHSIEGLTHDQVAITLFEARAPVMPSAAAAATATQPPPTVLGTRTEIVLAVLLLAAGLCAMVLPSLLRRRQLDWRTWLQQVVRR